MYAHRVRLTEAMARLALAFVLQHTEQLDDAEAAAAVRARLGWKQVLSLERDAPGLMPPSWSMFAPCCWRLAPKSGC
ncbi:hypothetical protein [Roseiflexus sp.]|uniref:hypothetical protein n=1 Tax=Roseiflexus sp. TaxID=2562120 RepID=UPI002586D52B|nr:hypothetical protein [Roseiflexus sp.]